MSAVQLHQAEVFLKCIYQRRGLKMLTKAAREDFEFYAAQEAALDKIPLVSIQEIAKRGEQEFQGKGVKS